MNRFLINTFGVVGAALVLLGCAPKLTEGPEKLPKVKEKEILAAIDSLSQVRPSFLYTKIDTRYQDSTDRIKFKTSLRIKADSALNAIITYANIPIVTAMVTEDSLKVSNKKDKCYMLEDLDYFKQRFGIDFTFRNIEELFYGLPLGYDPSDKYFQINDPYNYIVSSHRKWEIRRTERNGRLKDAYIIKYFLHPDLQNIKRVEIESVEDSTNVAIDYYNYQQVGNYRIPQNMALNIASPVKVISIEMEFDKVEVDEPRELFITIPESYERCK